MSIPQNGQQETRQYVGKGKYIEFRNGGGKWRISLTPDGLDIINRNVSSSGWGNIVMTEMRQPDSRGNQYTLYLDDYHPENGGSGPRSSRPSGQYGGGRTGGQTPSAAGHRYSSGYTPTQRVNNGGFDGGKPEEPAAASESNPAEPAAASPDETYDDIPF